MPCERGQSVGGQSRGRGRRGGGGGHGFVADSSQYQAGVDGGGSFQKRCRAPCDVAPYDEDEFEGPCFACQWCASASSDAAGASVSAFEQSDIQDSNTAMSRIWTENWNSGTLSQSEVLDLVSNFYKKEIQTQYDGMPPWTKKSIFMHITRHAASDESTRDDMISLLRIRRLASSGGWRRGRRERHARSPESEHTAAI